MKALTLTVTIIVAATSMSLAQGPPSDECGQVVTESGETTTSIQSCMGELLDEQSIMIDNVENMGEELRTINLLLLNTKGAMANQRATLLGLVDDSDNIELMRDQLGRARQENLAVEDTDYADAFERADQQKGKDCKLSDTPYFESLNGDYPPGLKPFSGSNFDPKFGDDHCNAFKARIDNPGEPDDNEVVHINERSENMCETVCGDRADDSSALEFGRTPRPRKEKRKDRTVSELTDNIAAARRANDQLEKGRARMSALREQLTARVLRMTRDDEEICEPLDIARVLDELAEGVGLIKETVAVVTASLELAKETARPPSKQDAAGFNASSAETPFSVAAGVSKIIEQAIGFIEQGFKVAAVIAGRIQDFAQAQCLQNVQTQVVALQETAGETSAQLATLEAKVDALSARVDELLELLRTPPGRREGFPSKP